MASTHPVDHSQDNFVSLVKDPESDRIAGVAAGVIQLRLKQFAAMFRPAEARYRITQVIAVGLLACLAGQGAQEAPPDAAEQRRMLDAMSAYAEHYVANLPNFLCEQVTRQYEAGRKPDRWRSGDVLRSKLLFSNGEEQRHLELVNDRPIRPGTRRWRTPLQTEGEFGILLDRVFGAESQASFAWKGWEMVRGERTAVFAFAIDAEHSTMTLRLSDLAKATVPYYGTVYGDPASGAIWRITDAATNLPKELRTKSISTAIDYDQVRIGEKSYLLPVQASIWMTTDTNNVRNDLEFRNYRKFEADSVIKFASADEPAGAAGDPKD